MRSPRPGVCGLTGSCLPLMASPGPAPAPAQLHSLLLSPPGQGPFSLRARRTGVQGSSVLSVPLVSAQPALVVQWI